MYIILKIEVKNNYDGKLEYIQEDIVGTSNSVKGASEIMNTLADAKIANGYFNKVTSRSETYVNLTNGGTAYLKYVIHKI